MQLSNSSEPLNSSHSLAPTVNAAHSECQLATTIQHDLEPESVIARGTKIANALMDIVKKKNLYKNFNGKDYLLFEAWLIILAFEQINIVEESVVEKNGSYEATVRLERDGNVIGRGSALCGADEKNWKNRDNFSRRSMSVTRAAAKACRLKYGWIASLAGYCPTPSEEMEGESAAQGSGEIQRANSRSHPNSAIQSSTPSADQSGNGTGARSSNGYDPQNRIQQDWLIAQLMACEVDEKLWDLIGNAMSGLGSDKLQEVISRYSIKSSN